MNLAQIANLSIPLDPAFLQAINGENPFDRPLFVKQNHIWERKFFDVPEINAEASNFVLQAVSQIRAGRRSTLGITLTAERGLGKSHIISRIRHDLLAGKSAFFIYMGDYNNTSNIKQEFLQAVAYSLKHSMRSNHMQWQELATAMFNSATSKNWASKHLVDEWIPRQIKECRQKNSSILHIIIHLTKSFLKSNPRIQNQYLIQAIFWTLAQPYASTAINWIAGNGITPAESAAMGLPVANEESDSFNAFAQTQEILNLLGEFMPVVICLDELDSNIESRRASFVAGLGKDILNSLKRGIVLTTMFPQTWASQIKTMPEAESVVDRIGENVIELKHLNTQSITSLVSAWLDEFYFEKGYKPSSCIYPFTPEEMHIIGDERPTCRAALQDCRQLFGEKINRKPQEHPVKAAYEEELKAIQDNIDEWMENADAISAALWLGFHASIGQNIGSIKVSAVEEFKNLSAADQNYLRFKVVAKEDGAKTAKIGVTVLQAAGGAGIGACLKRLMDYEKFEITRGCLVRSKPINNSARQAHQLVMQLIGEKKGEWVNFLPEHIMPLLAISKVYAHHEGYELNQSQILDFIQHNKLAAQNSLLEEILSRPSGKIPKGLLDGNILMTMPSNSQDAEDAAAISIENDFGHKQEWIYEITKLADRSLEDNFNAKSNYQAGTDFENIVRTSLEFLGFTVDYSHSGGAGGLDLYCSHPFPLVGECKCGESIPSGTVEELLKLGRMHVGEEISAEQFDAMAKLIIGPGKPTADLIKAATSWKISIISASALQKLVELRALYPGSFSLLSLKPYFRPGYIDDAIEEFMNQEMFSKLEQYRKIIDVMESLANASENQPVLFDPIQQAFLNANPGHTSSSAKNFHELLVELSSPLSGYLGRIKGSLWDQDRFYFRRRLPTP